jgi:hypothetical protein
MGTICVSLKRLRLRLEKPRLSAITGRKRLSASSMCATSCGSKTVAYGAHGGIGSSRASSDEAKSMPDPDFWRRPLYVQEADGGMRRVTPEERMAQIRDRSLSAEALLIQRVIDAAKEWRAARGVAIADISLPGTWDRLANAEAALLAAVAELDKPDA